MRAHHMRAYIYRIRAQCKVPHRRLGEAEQRKAANYTGFVFNFSKAKVRTTHTHSTFERLCSFIPYTYHTVGCSHRRVASQMTRLHVLLLLDVKALGSWQPRRILVCRRLLGCSASFCGDG